MFRHGITKFAVLLGAIFFLSECMAIPGALAQKGKPPEEDPEIKLGRENAKSNDEQPGIKFITDAKLLDRVNKIGQDIAAVANVEKVPALWGSPEVKKFPYSFKIVDDKDVNAYSLPGGFIYVNKGTLDYVHSDDELAGVLAHEIAHAAHHHMIKLIREQNKLQPWSLLALLAAVLAGGNRGGTGVDPGAIMMATQLYLVARLNSYGVEAEKDADATGLRYLTKTKYNPVGLLTFMERLARDESRRPEQNLGIYKTHPPSPERAKSALTLIESLDIPINRHATDPYLSARVAKITVNEVPLGEVTVNKTLIARLAPSQGSSGEARAEKFSDILNDLMDQDLQQYELKLSVDKRGILARGKLLLMFADEDAAAQKADVTTLSKNALDAIRNLIWQTQFDRAPPSTSARR
jgi:predicted Zn-dependent protease